jgi:hypothetical protein
MSVAAFDPLRVLRLLSDRNVEFVVIGGFAARIWGSPTITNDLDLCYATTRSNVELLAAVLNEIEARLRDFPADLPFVLDARTLSLGNSFTFETSAGNVDCLATPSGTTGFDDLARNSKALDLGDGLIVHFASLADVIRMKRAADRPKDRIEVEILEALKAELESTS